MSQGLYGEIFTEDTRVAGFASWRIRTDVSGGMTLLTITVDKLTVYNHDHPFEGQVQQFLDSLNNFATIPFFTVHLYDKPAGPVVDTKQKCMFTHINPIAPGLTQYKAIIAVQD